METELIAVLLTIGLGWAGWISVTVIQNQKELKVLSSMNEKFESMDGKIGGLSTRLDTFLKTEIEALKGLVKG